MLRPRPAPALLVLLLVASALGDYVWDGEEWKWQDTVAAQDEEGSGGGRYHQDDEDDSFEGSADESPSYARKDDSYDTKRIHEEINVDADEEIDEVDIGFPDEPSPSKAPPVVVSPSTPAPGPPTEEPHRQPQGETNFFAQPGILAAVVGGTVVGLLCTILLVMLIVYRMRKADEGSYSLNEPKRSPNVHSYLKAPTREFFA